MISLEDRTETEDVFCKNFIEKNEIYDTKSLQDTYSLCSTSSLIEKMLIFPFSVEEDIKILPESLFNDCSIDLNNPFEQSKPKTRNKIFEVIHPKRFSVFSQIENENSSNDDDTLIQRKRFPTKRRRRENKDNMLKKIKRGFLNNALLQKINMLIKKNGGKYFFEKFQLYFISDVTKKSNKMLIDMTLEEIYMKKELYHEKELKYYYRNLNVLKSKEIQENKELKNILSKKYCELFEEYVNSKEFKIDEIERLKSNNMEESYIKRYIYLAKNFIKFIRD